MKMLADIVTKNGGEVLEVGFGLGISARFIQKHKIKTHTIIESHPDVIKRCQKIYSEEIRNKKIVLLKGFWEDITYGLPKESFDGILFDTYPEIEQMSGKNHFFFFKEAYRLLKRGGIFTYYSDEATGFSKTHLQRLNDAGFTDIKFNPCKINPPEDCNYWNKKSIIAPIIIK